MPIQDDSNNQPGVQVLAVYDDRLRFLFPMGQVHIERASHVIVRGTLWYADLSPRQGPLLGPFHLRTEAVKAERQWLNEQMLKYASCYGPHNRSGGLSSTNS